MRVLLALDHSTASDQAIEYLRSLPFRQSVDLSIVTVISPVPFIDATAAGVPADIGGILEEERRHFESRLADSMARFDDDSFRSVSGEVRIGSPAQELKTFADSNKVDLVVMGAVGHSALQRVLLGSVSDYVATHAEASTLVVRPHGNGSASVPNRILLALDCSDQDEQLAQWLQRLELSTSTEVHLVHVMRLLTFYSQDVLQRATELWKEARASAEAHAKSMAKTVDSCGFDVTSNVIAAAHVGDTLITYADDHECELIITGDHHRGKLSRLFMGSVSRDVLRHASCSVLVAR
jgi:nucleotide-binding universal stress UspA family protein